MSTSDQEHEIQNWMENVARRQPTQRVLVFDKKTKRLVAVTKQDPRADDSTPITPEEARRFIGDQPVQ